MSTAKKEPVGPTLEAMADLANLPNVLAEHDAAVARREVAYDEEMALRRRIVAALNAGGWSSRV